MVVLATGSGQEDAHWGDARIFLDGTRTLILGEVEDEYSLGLQALEVDPMGGLSDLQLPCVALPDTSEGSMGPGASALESASVSLLGGEWSIAFNDDLIIDPGSEKQTLLCRVDQTRPITLLHSAGRWSESNAARQNAGDPLGPLQKCR